MKINIADLNSIDIDQVPDDVQAAIDALAVSATDISHGIWESAQSLAMALEGGEISNAEAMEQLAELQADLAEAEAEVAS
tara:strand:+ start:542 stop:781 length:240 start_codon:yes stop_codon:yes gene_type:complete